MDSAAPQLRDIHLPPAPGWWPPAPGWWVVAALLVALIAFLVWKWRRVAARRRLRSAVLAELKKVRADWLHHANGQRFVADLSQFLRRISRVIDPQSVALSGAEWLAFLDRHGDGFVANGQSLLDATYRPGVSIDADALYDLVERHTEQVLEREWRHV